MNVETKLMSADELLAMPDDGAHRYELARGELIKMSPAGTDHGDIAMEIGSSLRQFVKTHRLGKVYSADTGFLIARNPDTVRAPDASFVAAARVVSTEKYFPGPPDLAVEVVSPHDSYAEIEEKAGEYLAAGTRMVIVVDPRTRTATVSTPAGIANLTIDDSLTGGDVVPGWTLPLRDLFDAN